MTSDVKITRDAVLIAGFLAVVAMILSGALDVTELGLVGMFGGVCVIVYVLVSYEIDNNRIRKLENRQNKMRGYKK